LLGLLSQLVWELQLRLITLADGQEYSRETLGRDPARLHGLLAYAQSAHAESERKSRHMRSVWSRKFKSQELGKVLTAQVPWWVEVIRDERGKPIGTRLHPERKGLMRRVVDLRLQGWSDRRITALLESEGHQFGRTTVRRWLIDQPERLAGIHPAHRSIAGPDGKYRRKFERMIPGAYPALIGPKELAKLKAMTAAGVDRDPVTTPALAAWSLAGLCRDTEGRAIRRHKAGPSNGRDKLVFKDGPRVPVEIVEAGLKLARAQLEEVPGGVELDEDLELELETGVRDLTEALRKRPSVAGAELLASMEEELRAVRAEKAKATEDRSGRVLRVAVAQRLPGLWDEDVRVRNSAARFCFERVVLQVVEGGEGEPVLIWGTFEWRGGGRTEVVLGHV
jgi:hypothetical protein